MTDQPWINAHFPTLQVPLTNEQAYLYTNNAAFKTIVDTFLQAHLPLYLEGAAVQAHNYERRMREDIARMNDASFRKEMSVEELRDLVQAAENCAICGGTGFDAIGRPCRIHGPETQEQGK